MSKKRSTAGMVALLVLITGAFVIMQTPPAEALMKGGYKVITIYGEWEKDKAITRLEPSELWTSEGRTVIWMNMADSEVKIIFEKGKECKKVTSAALGWTLDTQECYVTGHSIPTGGTTSVRFMNLGRFTYTVEYVGKNRTEKGVIEVRPARKGENPVY
jgi:hypothetical protein